MISLCIRLSNLQIFFENVLERFCPFAEIKVDFFVFLVPWMTSTLSYFCLPKRGGGGGSPTFAAHCGKIAKAAATFSGNSGIQSCFSEYL